MLGIICLLLTLYIVVIVLRVVLTWFPVSPGSPMVTVNSVLASMTDPVLGPVRRVIPPLRIGGAMLDLSFLVVVLGGGVVLSLLGC